MSRRSLMMVSVVSLAAMGCHPDDGGTVTALEPAVEANELEVYQGGSADGHMLVTVGAYTYSAEIYGDMVIAEGDIVLGTVAELSTDADGNPLPPGAGRLLETYRWPDGVVPYVIDDNVPEAVETMILGAIAEWEANTLIRLVERTTETDYVRFDAGDFSDEECSDKEDNDEDGDVDGADKNCSRGYRSEDYVCASFIGRQTNEQVILTQGCSQGSLVHEIGHAIGLHHEQSRSDRDEWLTVDWDNIEDEKDKNFETYIERERDGVDLGPMDFDSIMMYPTDAFAVDTSSPTLWPNVGTASEQSRLANSMGQRNGLSEGDIYAITRMYTDAWYLSDESRGFWQPVLTEDVPLGDTLVGDFDGDNVSETLTADGTAWTIRDLRTEDVDTVRYGFLADNLHVGDFDGDGVDEVMLVWFQAWYYHDLEDNSWTSLGSPNIPADEIIPGDFDGDGVTDMLHSDGYYWTIYWDSTTADRIPSVPLSIDEIRIGDLDGDGRDEIFIVYYGYMYTYDAVTGRWDWLDSTDASIEDLLIVNTSWEAGDEVVYLDGQALYTWTSDEDGMVEKWSTQVTADSVLVGQFDGHLYEDLLALLPQVVE